MVEMSEKIKEYLEDTGKKLGFDDVRIDVTLKEMITPEGQLFIDLNGLKENKINAKLVLSSYITKPEELYEKLDHELGHVVFIKNHPSAFKLLRILSFPSDLVLNNSFP